MPNPSPTITCVPPDLLNRLHRAAAALDISTHAAVLAACNALIPILTEGWRPSACVETDGKTYLSLRIPPVQKKRMAAAAKLADLSLSDFVRVAAAATVGALEGKPRVWWPLAFTPADFNRAVRNFGGERHAPTPRS